MQTFLPEYTFAASAAVLDNKRLNKQLLEGRQILSALLTGKGWIHHPATKMWAGSEWWLVQYCLAVKEECDRRGIRTEKNWSAILELTNYYILGMTEPTWLPNGRVDKRIMITHRGRLYEKDPLYYNKYSTEAGVYKEYVCCPRCNYYWPVHTSTHRPHSEHCTHSEHT